jgi:hypothetical protein
MVGAAEEMVATGTVSMPLLTGYLMAVVDAYRGALARLAGGAR